MACFALAARFALACADCEAPFVPPLAPGFAKLFAPRSRSSPSISSWCSPAEVLLPGWREPPDRLDRMPAEADAAPVIALATACAPFARAFLPCDIDRACLPCARCAAGFDGDFPGAALPLGFTDALPEEASIFPALSAGEPLPAPGAGVAPAVPVFAEEDLAWDATALCCAVSLSEIPPPDVVSLPLALCPCEPLVTLDSVAEASPFRPFAAAPPLVAVLSSGDGGKHFSSAAPMGPPFLARPSRGD